MTEQNSDSNFKQQDYSKWVKGQSTGALEKELRNLELRQMVLQNAGPMRDAQIEKQAAEEWSEEDLDQFLKNYKAELEAAKTEEERKQIMEDYEGRSLDESTNQCVADQLATEPENMAQSQTGIDQAETAPAWLAERVDVNLRIGAVQRELTVRRHQESSKGGAASALAGAQKLPKAPSGNLMPSYRSKLKQGIWMQLAQNPRATNSQIVRGLDADGTAELPATWESDGNERSFWQAFTGIHKDKVEKEISRVRTDLRKRRLLPPR